MRNRSTTLPGKMAHVDTEHVGGLTETRRKVFELVMSWSSLEFAFMPCSTLENWAI